MLSLIYYIFERFSDIHIHKDVNLIINSAVKYNHQITRVSVKKMSKTGQNWISPKQLSDMIEDGSISPRDIIYLYHLGVETYKFLKIIQINYKYKKLPKIYVKCDFSGYLPVFGCPPPLNSKKHKVAWQLSKIKNTSFYFRLFKLIANTEATLIFESEAQLCVFESFVPHSMKTVVVPNPIFKSVVPKKDKNIDFIAIGNWNLEKQKNPQLLHEIFKNICEKYTCVIIGSGASKFFGNLDLQTFEKLEHDTVRDFIAKSKFLVSTSRFEGFPNIFLEAINGHTKILSTDYPAARSVVQQGLARMISFDAKQFDIESVLAFDAEFVDFDKAISFYSENYWLKL